MSIIPFPPGREGTEGVKRITGELRLIQARLQRLEIGLEAVSAFAKGKETKKVLFALQEIDILIQSSTALADFLDSISKASEDDNEKLNEAFSEALENIPLRDMADRLSGNSTTSINNGLPEIF